MRDCMFPACMYVTVFMFLYAFREDLHVCDCVYFFVCVWTVFVVGVGVVCLMYVLVREFTRGHTCTYSCVLASCIQHKVSNDNIARERSLPTHIHTYTYRFGPSESVGGVPRIVTKDQLTGTRYVP